MNIIFNILNKEFSQILVIVLAAAGLFYLGSPHAASAIGTPSKSEVCKEISVGKYNNVHLLFPKNSKLAQTKLNNDRSFQLTESQLKELNSIATKCAMSKEFPIGHPVTVEPFFWKLVPF